jgi:hypothetical protein
VDVRAVIAGGAVLMIGVVLSTGAWVLVTMVPTMGLLVNRSRSG